MKKVFVIAAAAMMLAACQKEEVSTTKTISLNASMEQMSGDSKTQLDGLNVVWEEGDEILVFDQNKKSATLKATKGGSETTFTGEVGDDFGTIQYAFYPATGIFDETSYTGTKIQYTLKNGNRTYAVDNIGSGENPSYAIVNGAKSANFKNICGIIKITVDVQKGFLKGLNLKADTGESMCGKFELTLDSGNSTRLSSDFNAIIIYDKDASDLENGEHSFYYVVPATTYTSMKLRTNNETSGASINTTKTNKVERSEILSMPKLYWDGMGLRKY